MAETPNPNPDQHEPEEAQEPKGAYLELLNKIQSEPHSEDTWMRVVKLAKAEEALGDGSESYYAKIPLDELIGIGERLRATKMMALNNDPLNWEKPKQYDILAEKCSTGEYWYDIILGHVNDKAFVPVKTHLDDLIKLRKGKKFESGLDVGSGLGNTLRAVAPCFRKIVGVEKLHPLAKSAKNEGFMPKNVEVINADAIHLPFADESFDVVVSNGLTHYLERGKMQEYVREVSRVLRDGGRYLEAFTVKNSEDSLPAVEAEYLTSAKALLVCLIDNIVSKVDADESSIYKDTEDDFQSWSFVDMSTVFSNNKVYLRRDVDSERKDAVSIKDNGIKVAEFVKQKSRRTSGLVTAD